MKHETILVGLKTCTIHVDFVVNGIIGGGCARLVAGVVVA